MQADRRLDTDSMLGMGEEEEERVSWVARGWQMAQIQRVQAESEIISHGQFIQQRHAPLSPEAITGFGAAPASPPAGLCQRYTTFGERLSASVSARVPLHGWNRPAVIGSVGLDGLMPEGTGKLQLGLISQNFCF